ncbi:MAG: hypothetical protein FVQ84_07630 [Planctomycetes bacterium]|nr:hypothetical protein [Planctomycetota bacterium]
MLTNRDILQIGGVWIIITISRTAAWIIWPRRHSQRCVLSKAPVPSALLKIMRIVVNYSHDGRTNIRGQVNVMWKKHIFGLYVGVKSPQQAVQPYK